MKSRSPSIVLLSSLLLVAGCSSGGGSSSSTPPVVTPPVSPPPPPPPPPPPANSQTRPINTAANAPLASIDVTTGALHYGLYANEGQSNADHLIPDFSYAGYQAGGVPLPAYDSIPVQVTLNPIANTDDFARIQAAIDDVAALAPDSRGIRGAVLLTAGLYEVSDELKITTNGVVLRGEGQGPTGTILRATTTVEDSNFLTVEGVGRGENPEKAANAAEVAITQSYVPVGSISVEVASTAGYAVGDLIAIRRIPNDFWLGPNGVNTAQYGWTASQYDVSFERTVTAIDGNTLLFDIPIVDTIEDQFGGGEVYRADVSGRLTQVGIENLRLETLTSADVANRNRAVNAIRFDEVQNSWIRDVTVRYFSRGFNMVDGVKFVTAQNVAHIDPDFEVVGGNHYAFDFNGGSMNFYQRCYSDQSRHAFTSGSRPTGPNVFLDCLNENGTNDSGPHQRWATGTLFDNTSDRLIRVQNRATFGSGHGWAGAQQMIWNGSYEDIVLQAPFGAMNWAVGNIGQIIQGSFPGNPDGIIEADGVPVVPRSLYLQQLEDRLGLTAVENVTYPAQRNGTVWTGLATWRGDDRLMPSDLE